MKNLFEPSSFSHSIVDSYLALLKVERAQPDLHFLNQLISAHQHTVPFENLTRICEFHELPAKLPTALEFVSRLKRGTGGVCWTMARTFYELLVSLKFDVNYLYMDPGHVSLQVKLDQLYYVEVGFGAPIFQAMPLKTSFTINAPNEIFAYTVFEDHVNVKRTPGPEKNLLFKPVDAAFLQSEFEKRNVIQDNRFLNMLMVGKFVDQKAIRIINGVFQDYRSGTLIETKLSGSELDKTLIDIFQFDPAVYHKAKSYLPN